MKKAISLLLVFVLLAGVLTGCVADENKPKDGKLNIVCTLFPLYDFTHSVVGDRADVSLMLPFGMECHSFEPTPSDIISLKNADLFIYVGEEMETWINPILAQLDKSTTVLELSDALGLKLESHKHSGGEDETDGEEHTEETSHSERVSKEETDGEKLYDPHIWTSPVIAVRMAEAIRDAATSLDSGNKTAYTKNADDYIIKLWELDEQIREIVNEAKRTEIIFGARFAIRNFTDEYGLTYLAAFDSCTEVTEPSAAAVAKIVDEIKNKKIPVVFYEELIEPTVAQSLAKSTGARPLLFHSCHNLSAEDFGKGENYISLMSNNIENLKIALS